MDSFHHNLGSSSYYNKTTEIRHFSKFIASKTGFDFLLAHFARKECGAISLLEIS